MHRAAGMEFARVLLFNVGRGSTPASYLRRGLSDADREDVLRKERWLLSSRPLEHGMSWS